MTEPRTSELVVARMDLESVLDELHPGTAATNTTLVNAIEALVRAILAEDNQ